jgi:type II secretory pathway pseudopilin PulG
MGRAFGLISIVVSLALVGILWALTMQHSGPTSGTAKKAERDASAAVSALNFTAASTQLEAFHAENATYVGATLPPSFGVTLVRADGASYCLQTGVGASAQHFAGPGGAAAAGPC